jgi:PST family polysaccharide transporter
VRSALTATGIIGAGSLASVGLSILTAKVYAVLIGPDGVGLLGLMQSLVMITAIAAGLGLNTAVIRSATEASNAQRATAGSISAAARLVAWCTGTIAGAFFVFLREPIARLALGTPEAASQVVVLAPAVVCSVAASVEVAILTSAGRIRSVTAVHVFTYFVAATAGIGLVAAFGVNGLAPAIVITAVAQVVASITLNHGRDGIFGSWSDFRAPARSLLREGRWFAASQLSNVGVQLAIPIVVLHALTTGDVGLYRASTTISIGYLSFFLASLTYDYLPRAAGAQDGDALRELIEGRMRLVAALAVPLILALLASGDFVLTALYSAEFGSAVSVLSWHLVGDLLRLPAWVLSFALMAKAPGRMYLGLEVLIGAVLLTTTAAGLRLFDLPGTGVAYAATQAVYLLIAWMLVRRFSGATPGRLQVVVVLVGAASAGVLIVDVAPVLRSMVFGVSAIVAAGLAWPRLLALHRARML